MAVLRASEEYKYVSKKQGIPFEYDSVHEIAQSLHKKTVDIALLDVMVAGRYQEVRVAQSGIRIDMAAMSNELSMISIVYTIYN